MRVFDFVSPAEHAQELLNYVKKSARLDDLDTSADPETVGHAVQRAVDALDRLVLAGVGDQDLEAVMNSLASLVPSVTQPDEASQLVGQLCDKIQEPSLHGKEAIMYRPLRNLFYAMGEQMQPISCRHQYRLLCAMLQVAGRCERSQYPSRMVSLQEAQEYLQKWQCTVDERRHCLRLLHRALLNGSQGAAPAKVMFELLSTYTTDVDAAAAGADDDAHECVRTAINDPDTYMYNHLFRLHPVQRLKGQPIYELLQVFDSGVMEDYLRFREKHQQFLEKTMGLEHDAYMEKMRVLTFMTLCQRAGRMTMQELGQRLMIDDMEELEQFIIRAVQTRMVQAEIDDAEDSVILRGAKPRCFDKNQWKLLLKGLEKWEAGIHKLQKYFENDVA